MWRSPAEFSNGHHNGILTIDLLPIEVVELRETEGRVLDYLGRFYAATFIYYINNQRETTNRLIPHALL